MTFTDNEATAATNITQEQVKEIKEDMMMCSELKEINDPFKEKRPLVMST